MAAHTPPPAKYAQWRKKYGAWAIVTGASDGIGREIAGAIAKRGVNLVLVARRQPVLDELAAELTQQYAIQTQVIAADLSQSSAVATVITAVRDLDVGLLVACAGFGTSGRLMDSDLAQELNMLDVNCRAILSLSHHFSQHFAQQRRGGIILMSSLLAFQGVPFAAHYAATKAYNQLLAEALHVELAPFGVDVLASAPGPVASGFGARANMNMTLSAKPQNVAEETLNALGRTSTVRPGWLSKFLELGLSFSPRRRRVRTMGRIMGGMTQHQATNTPTPTAVSST